MKTKLIISMFFCLTNMLFAQQEAQYTQYMYNSTIINPAYAGSRGALNVFVLNRSQWRGFTGAPTTTNLSVDTPINENLGIGLSILKDKIGPSDESNIGVNFSYGFYISEKYRLSFGINGSLKNLNIDFSNAQINDQNDYQFDTNIDNKFMPNVGIGIYLNSDNSYIGLSSPSLLKADQFDRYAGPNAISHVVNNKANLYLMGGHVFDIDYQTKFKPSLLIKYTAGAPLQIDVSANFLINEKFNLGLAYRWSAAISALVGFQVSNNWFIGYSYDMETTRLVNYNAGSHELFLRYELFNKYSRYVVAPRFF